MSEVFVYSYLRSNQKIYIFEWNVKATLNLLTYQILNLQALKRVLIFALSPFYILIYMF